MNVMKSDVDEVSRRMSRFQSLLSPRGAALAGVIGAVLTVEIARLHAIGLLLGCLSVAVLYAVYPIGALVAGTTRERAVEWSYALVGAASVVLALTIDPRWLAAGWLAHGVWDLLHRWRPEVGLEAIPRWYLDLCLVWDLLAAIGLALLLG